jgi:hypothetical protein
MDEEDKRGPFLGLYTDCCQHLHNAGSSCAKAGYKNPDSGFYVIEKDGQIVAQSWVWVDTTGKYLVLDSIEGLGSVSIESISELLRKGIKYLIDTNPFGIEKVLVGKTSYGLTEDIADYVRPKCMREVKPIIGASYMDGRKKQWEFPL